MIILDWTEIATTETSPTLLAKLEQALGPHGIGLVAIRNVPDFVATKNAFLPQGYKLVRTLPAEYLEQELTDAASLYNAGWSFGKEKLGDDKPPDTSKGSFYYNPVTDVPGTPQDRHKYPYSYPCNKWPTEVRLPGFRQDAKRMGMILKDATVELAKHIDALAATKCVDYPTQFLYQQMKHTDKVKARLLYYFPLPAATTADDKDETPQHQQQQDNNPPKQPVEDSWIGWHNDSGFLTALGGELYVNHETGQIVDCPDPAAGLYVAGDRSSTSSSSNASNAAAARHIVLPADCMAVQIGECTQIVTGGAVRATPHCVRGAAPATAPNVARISLPCFVDTPPYQALAMPPSATREQVLQVSNVDDSRVRPRRIREKLDLVPAMKSLTGSRVAAHVRHVAGDANRLDAVLLEPRFEFRARERPGQLFVDQDIPRT